MKRSFMFLSFLLICCFLFDSCGRESGGSQGRTPNLATDANGAQNTDVSPNQTNTSGTPVVNNSTPGSGSTGNSSSNIAKAKIPFTFNEGDEIELVSSTPEEATFEIYPASGGPSKVATVLRDDDNEWIILGPIKGSIPDLDAHLEASVKNTSFSIAIRVRDDSRLGTQINFDIGHKFKYRLGVFSRSMTKKSFAFTYVFCE